MLIRRRFTAELVCKCIGFFSSTTHYRCSCPVCYSSKRHCSGSATRSEYYNIFLFENRSYRRYGRSFGGHCLPKDTRAYVKWCKDTGRQSMLMEGILSSNDAHKKKEEKYPHLPTWFSNWTEPAGSGWIALHILGKSIRRNVLHPIAALKRRKTVEYRREVDD